MSKIEVNTVAPQCGTTLTLGESGDTVALGSGASQTGFGRTGTVDWDTTPKTATFTAINGDGFFCNTQSGGFTANLPAGVAGAIVSFADYANTWNTGNLTISPNGSDKIGGVNASVVLSTQGQSVTFVFADSTQGWLNVQDSTSNERGKAYVTATGGTTSTCGDFKFHKFTGPGTFCVSAQGNAGGSNTVQTLIVAGGGGGGFGQNCYGGGGGAGGLRNISCVPVSVQGYPVAVGAGGTAGNGATPTPSGNGSPSSVISNTSAGGGRGGSSHSPTPGASHSACSGGSGGGAAGRPSYGTAGTGNTPPVSPPQGNNGGGNGGTTAGGGGNELDAYVSYDFGPLALTVTNYTFPDGDGTYSSGGFFEGDEDANGEKKSIINNNNSNIETLWSKWNNEDEDKWDEKISSSKNSNNNRNYFYWSEGSISLGRVGDTSLSSTKKAKTEALTFGFDKFTDDYSLKGFAFRFGNDNVDVGNSGSRLESDTYNITYYSTSPVQDDTKMIDKIFGIGKIRSNLLTIVDGSKITADRTGNQIYGTVKLKDEFIKGKLTLIPSGQFDFAHTILKGYQESGIAPIIVNDQHVRTRNFRAAIAAVEDLSKENYSFKRHGKVEYIAELVRSSNFKYTYVEDKSVKFNDTLHTGALHNLNAEVGVDIIFPEHYSIFIIYERNQAFETGHTDNLYVALGYLPHKDTEIAFTINGSENLMSEFEIKKDINGFDLIFNLNDDLTRFGNAREAYIELNKVF